MLRHEAYGPGVLEQRFDRAVQRNAELMVALRHLIAHIHITQNGHLHAGNWTACPHERCRAVRQLVNPEGR